MRLLALLALPALALLLLAAHFLHAGWVPLAVVAVVLVALLAVPHPWVARGLQVVLVLGTLEWIRTAVVLASVREAHGAPWLRLALILGSVAALTAVAALVFQRWRVRAYYRLEGRALIPPPAGQD